MFWLASLSRCTFHSISRRGHMTVEARRVTEDEFDAFLQDGRLELIDGRIITRSGLELFVGVREFEEFRGRVERGEDGFIDETESVSR